MRCCDGRHTHISLKGNAPCGKSWTAIASPYWPAFSKEWVFQCAALFLAEFEARRPPLHFAGFPYVKGDVTVESLLRGMGFEVAGKLTLRQLQLELQLVCNLLVDQCHSYCPMDLGPMTTWWSLRV